MKYTLCFIFSEDLSQCLMIDKIKGPYPNTLNGIGGKIEDSDEDVLSAAYRELYEETNLIKQNLKSGLNFLVKLHFSNDIEVNVFYGRIIDRRRVRRKEEEELVWVNTKELLDVTNKRLAGDGNVPYFINFALNLMEGAA